MTMTMTALHGAWGTVRSRRNVCANTELECWSDYYVWYGWQSATSCKRYSLHWMLHKTIVSRIYTYVNLHLCLIAPSKNYMNPHHVCYLQYQCVHAHQQSALTNVRYATFLHVRVCFLTFRDGPKGLLFHVCAILRGLVRAETHVRT